MELIHLYDSLSKIRSATSFKQGPFVNDAARSSKMVLKAKCTCLKNLKLILHERSKGYQYTEISTILLLIWAAFEEFDKNIGQIDLKSCNKIQREPEQIGTKRKQILPALTWNMDAISYCGNHATLHTTPGQTACLTYMLQDTSLIPAEAKWTWSWWVLHYK